MSSIWAVAPSNMSDRLERKRQNARRARARICKPLRGPGIDFKESTPLAYVSWRAGPGSRFLGYTETFTSSGAGYHWLCTAVRMEPNQTLKGNFLNFSFYVRYSILLHLPPLRIQCVGGCWDRTQDSFDYGIVCQTL
jgi:hypothetical protein